MKHLSDHVLRALWYVDVLTVRGVAVTRDDVDLMATTEPPQDSLRRPWIFGPQIGDSLVRKAAPVANYLIKMQWIKDEAGGVTLTNKGSVVLAAGCDEGDLRESSEPMVADVELNPEDPLVFTHLTRRFAEAGAGMLVDAYFKADMLSWLTEGTTLRRVLSKRDRKELPLIAVALATLPKGAEVEVRATDSPDLHDRCLIDENGAVHLLGASITGIGRNQTAIITPDSAIMTAYRNRYEGLWNSAERVEPQSVRGTAPGGS